MLRTSAPLIGALGFTGRIIVILKHLAKEAILLPYLRAALADQFSTTEECDVWYKSLPSDSVRDTALRVLSSYLALVKAGDWNVEMEGVNPVIDYFTETYKCVGLIALIESLTGARHIDFHQYLVQKSTRPDFPLTRPALERVYKSYKAEYGSSKAVPKFFELLPKHRQAELAKSVEILNGDDIKSLTLAAVVRHIYQVRSNFVHAGAFAHDLASLPTFTKVGKKSALVSLSMPSLMTYFEEAFLAWCQAA